jgi:hypothetical protein
MARLSLAICAALPYHSGMSRREDIRLIISHGCCAADWNLPHQLHAVFLHADQVARR